MILFINFETSGLIDRRQPLESHSQPFLLSLSAELDNGEGIITDFAHLRVRAPEGRKVQAGATNVHGITSRQAASAGLPETCALGVVCHLAAQARYVVGHGVEHARDVAVGRLMSLGKATKLITRPGLEWICTMKASAAVCKLPSDRDDGGYKWPSLKEAGKVVCGFPPDDRVESVWESLQTMKQIFEGLRERGVVEVEI